MLKCRNLSNVEGQKCSSFNINIIATFKTRMNKLHVQALNECLGIDGPIWIEDNGPDPKEFIQVPSFVYSNRGIPHTKETKRKIKEKATGRIMSVDARKKMSESHIGKRHPNKVKVKIGQSQLGKNNHNYQYDWKLTFKCGKVVITSSMPTWCKNNGYDKSALMRVCKKQVGKHKDIVAVEKLAHRTPQATQETL
jgi:hypothetical protein